MAALDSAERAARALLRFPVIFLGAGGFAALKLPVEATRPLRISLDAYAVLALATFLFTPLLLAGLYGLADGALDGDGSASSFAGGLRGYPRLLGANLLYATFQHLLLLAFTLLFVAVFVLAFGGVGVLAEATRPGEPLPPLARAIGSLGLAGLVVVGFLYVAVRFVVGFFLQLYRPAAVVGGAGPLAAFAESYRLVRANAESALGFLLLRVVVAVVLALPGLVALVAFVAVEVVLFDQLGEGAAWLLLAGLLVVGFVAGVVELAFFSTYAVAYYRSLVDET